MYFHTSSNVDQKIIKLGRSYAVIIDKNYFNCAGWEIDKPVRVRYDHRRSLVMIRQMHLFDKPTLEMPEEFPEYQPTAEFERWLLQFFRAHRGFLQRVIKEKPEEFEEFDDWPVG